MMQQWPDSSHIDETIVFAAVAHHRSFTNAAVALGRDATVLSRRVSSLERRLGIRLFERTTRKVALTEAGEALFVRVGPSLSAILEAEGEVMAQAGGEPQGQLRLTLPATFGRMWIAPLLSAFMAAYPRIRIEAEFSNRFVDLIADGFDAAVRIGDLPDSSLVARKIATHSRMLCAAPSYLERCGAPQMPEDLSGHACLGFTGFKSFPDWRLIRHGRGDRVTVRVDAPLVTDDAEALVAAAVRGVGIMMSTDWLIGREIATGQLVPVLGDWTTEDEGAIYVVVPSNRLLAGKTRAFVDWMAKSFAPEPPWRVALDSHR